MTGVIFKTIRNDELDFWDAFIKELLNPSIQKPELRLGSRKAFTIKLVKDASGAYQYKICSTNKEEKRKDPSEAYNEDDKQNFTRHQSTSYANPEQGYKPPYFGHSNGRKDLLVGMSFDPDSCLFKRIMMYDVGTIARPYDFDTAEQADAFLQRKIAQGEYHTSLPSLQESALKSSHLVYNEVMAKLQWNDRCTITVFSNNLASRLLAQVRTADLHKRLQDAGKPQVVKITIYPDFSEYTQEAQAQDRAAAEQDPTLKRYLNTLQLLTNPTIMIERNDFILHCEEWIETAVLLHKINPGTASPLLNQLSSLFVSLSKAEAAQIKINALGAANLAAFLKTRSPEQCKSIGEALKAQMHLISVTDDDLVRILNSLSYEQYEAMYPTLPPPRSFRYVFSWLRNKEMYLSDAFRPKKVGEILAYAAEHGNLPLVTHILSLTGDNKPDKVAVENALFKAARLGHLPVVSHIIGLTGARKPDREAVIKVLKMATSQGCWPVVNHIIGLTGDNKPDRQAVEEALDMATYHGCWPVVNHILNLTGENKPERDAVEMALQSARNTLFADARSGDFPSVINILSLTGNSKLDQAAVEGALSIAVNKGLSYVVTHILELTGDNKPSYRVLQKALISARIQNKNSIYQIIDQAVKARKEPLDAAVLSELSHYRNELHALIQTAPVADSPFFSGKKSNTQVDTWHLYRATKKIVNYIAYANRGLTIRLSKQEIRVLRQHSRCMSLLPETLQAELGLTNAAYEQAKNTSYAMDPSQRYLHLGSTIRGTVFERYDRGDFIDENVANSTEKFTYFDIPEGITKISARAFAAAPLHRVEIPNTVRVIKDEAFAHCPQLRQVELPTSLTKVSVSAFEDCPNLTRITVDTFDFKDFVRIRQILPESIRALAVPRIPMSTHHVENYKRLAIEFFETISRDVHKTQKQKNLATHYSKMISLSTDWDKNFILEMCTYHGLDSDNKEMVRSNPESSSFCNHELKALREMFERFDRLSP